MNTHLNAREILYQNLPYDMQWSDKSFLCTLHDDRKLDLTSYWQLEWAVLQLTTDQIDYPRHLSCSVFQVFICAASLLYDHTNPDDDYEIKDVSRSVVHQLRQRMEAVFEGFFKGRHADMRAFKEINPLLN
ncbi:hypothetical protein G5S34_21455 [Herbaspirillum frisingense]|uniref:Imm41 family immunity protein n=1 Tax=Herbaspirillum frisingense TaxID=92645 RepID=UPI001600DB29|nr:Imm41 family immunity protein [Herbaspirillum frisingense]QNB09059.1 hypothetical protein G5S34_21455 [Herbaspirillum frisingense]